MALRRLKVIATNRLVVIIALGLVLVVAGAGALAFGLGLAASPPTAPTPTPTVFVPPTPTLGPGLSPQTSSGNIQKTSSWNIQIPDIGVNAPVVPVGTEADGSMASPSDADSVGWFSGSPRPGQAGNVLLDGHLDWYDRVTGAPRTAVFWRLKELVPGNKIYVTDGQRRFTYLVTESLLFRSDDPASLQVLQATSDARVTLITCEGVYDQAARNYSHRRVVIAQLAESP